MSCLLVTTALVAVSRVPSVRAFGIRSLSVGNGIATAHRGSPATVQKLYMQDTEADMMEMLVGGEKYSMIPMPDSMKSTTVFVGNLCEFVQDGDLSNLFSQVSSLKSLPCSVVRKLDTTSMQYGFVSFPTKKEKEAAILLLNNFDWRGKKLRVECIRDHPKSGRVRIPERLVEYVSGSTKKTKSGELNTLRRISRDDVDRLSRGQPSKKKGYGSRSVPHRLNDEERNELDRAARKGFLSLLGGGSRRARKGSPLANIHRQWCDARGKPQVMLYKAVGGNAIDQVIIDLSPLRLNGAFDDAGMVEDCMTKWKSEIFAQAAASGMETDKTGAESEDDSVDDESSVDNKIIISVASTTSTAWSTFPIWKLPMVPFVFEGERSKAKTMASDLAKLWEIPEEDKAPGRGAMNRRTAGAKKGGKTKMKGLSEYRKRGGGHRQAW